MADVDHAEIVRAVDEARALRHPMRAMCVTLECGHYRLMPNIDCAQAVGGKTACPICSESLGGQVVRMGVRVEETGVLHDDWMKGRGRG